jgi:hypothetical protein
MEPIVACRSARRDRTAGVQRGRWPPDTSGWREVAVIDHAVIDHRCPAGDAPIAPLQPDKRINIDVDQGERRSDTDTAKLVPRTRTRFTFAAGSCQVSVALNEHPPHREVRLSALGVTRRLGGEPGATVRDGLRFRVPARRTPS